MKVLWLCNITLPDIAKELNLKASNKEGWLSGVLSAVKNNHDFELAVAFPTSKIVGNVTTEIEGIKYYAFVEDINHPEKYDKKLEGILENIIKDSNPDLIHSFGTEFPHTLELCNVMADKPERVLLGMQGVVGRIAEHYCDGLPKRVVNRVTFRDFLKRDSVKRQQSKFEKRAANEVAALKIAGHVTGRTPLDLEYSKEHNPNISYHFMNETLRTEFYEGLWTLEGCERHSIFFSQANYPIKGFHIFLESLKDICKKYPDAKVYVAGDNITRHSSIKERIKLSSYGKYLLELIKKYELGENICFIGNVSADTIKDRLFKSNVFVATSTMENSPNSLAEAMLLGVPCVTTNVGGISGVFEDGKDGIMCDEYDVAAITEGIIKIFESAELAKEYSRNAKHHAEATHDPETNYKRLLEIYSHIANA